MAIALPLGDEKPRPGGVEMGCEDAEDRGGDEAIPGDVAADSEAVAADSDEISYSSSPSSADLAV